MFIAKAAQWRRENLDRARQLQRASQKRHSKQKNIRDREWRKNNKEHYDAMNRKYAFRQRTKRMFGGHMPPAEILEMLQLLYEVRQKAGDSNIGVR